MTPPTDSAPPLRIALVGPVAQSIPPARSGSIETVTAMLADGLTARGHEVTLFATASSTTSARLHAVFEEGYNRDTDLWPWELCELFNVAAAVERAEAFDLIHCQAEYAPLSLALARIAPVPVVQTVHHAPSAPEATLWSRYAEAPFIAVSRAQAELLAGLDVAAIIHHAVDPRVFEYRGDPDDYLLFLGRFTPEKGVLEAMDVARLTGHRLVLAAADNDYYRTAVAPLVDGDRVAYAGEADLAAKVALLQGARALLYPLQAPESFGLVLVEAMMCGTPVAALDRGAVREVVDEGRTGHAFASLDALAGGLDDVLALDRGRVRARALERFRPERMVNAHVDAYRRIVAAHARRHAAPPPASGAGGPPSLLAVFAHPDDESLASGGLLAWCAAVGVRVSLLCLTHGEHGHAGRGAPAPRTRSLRQVRAGELRAAAEVLGVAGVRLLDHEDGMLPWIPPGRLDADILDEIRRAAPDVVITFDADGLYWHPDHIAVHERTTAVVAALGAGAPALFHVTLPPGAMRAVVDHAARVAAVRGLAPPFPRTILGVGDADAFGAGAPLPTLVVDARDHAAQKLRALRCHRSQLESCALRLVDEVDAARLLGREHYRRSAIGARGDTILDRLAAEAATRTSAAGGKR